MTNDHVTGTVTNITDFGAFIELEDGVEGLVHISEITSDKEKKAEDVLKVGDTVTAKILNINNEDRKIGLSIKAYLDEKEKMESGEYIKDSFQKGKVSLGEILQQATDNQKENGEDQVKADDDTDTPEEVVAVEKEADAVETIEEKTAEEETVKTESVETETPETTETETAEEEEEEESNGE